LKPILLILIWLLPAIARTQVKDSLRQGSVDVNHPEKKQSLTSNSQHANNTAYQPEVFTSGFIDLVNSGQVNASARFIRLFIGEPGKFSVPLSLYSGVSSNNFQNTQNSTQRSNDALFTNFINPLSGLANVSIDGVLFLKNKTSNLTRAGILYHTGERILTGIKTGSINDPATGKPINFFNSFASLGLYFQTGAWERNNAKNVGVYWFAARYIGCFTNAEQLKEILPGIKTNGLYHGFSIAWGVEVNNLVNIKVVYYKYIKKPEINYLLPIYQFTFNYSVKK
jgi:hypothetical protein